MPRYELVTWFAKKFWTIERAGKTIRITSGKIGKDGKLEERALASEAAAERSFASMVAEKTRAGYQLVAGPGSSAADVASRPAVPASLNPELEAAILADPDDQSRYLVYADWLQGKGDPRGELIALMAAGKDHQAWLAEHAASFVGGIEDLVETGDSSRKPGLTWRWGYVQKLRLAHDHYADTSSELDLAEALPRALAHPSLRFLTALEFGLNRDDGEAEYAKVVEALAQHPVPQLRSLYLADFEYPDENEMSWTHLGDLGPLWAHLPGLRELTVQGGSFALGELELPELRSARFVTGGLSAASFASILGARWPELESLEIWFGDDGYGAEVSFDDLAPLLAGTHLTKLTHLGLKNAAFADDIAQAIVGSQILPQLRSLDLSMGTLSDEGAAHLVAHKAKLAHLERLDVSQSYLSETMIDALQGLVAEVESDDQREGDGDDRYVSVGE
jgi:uncharacterized protein (TIGR02996 family)